MVDPDPASKLQEFFAKHGYTFAAIADSTSKLLKLLGQETNWLRFGKMPAVIGVRPDGQVAFLHKGTSMTDFPDWRKALEAITPSSA